MDVPFLSSSAINREHYSLVQSVEAAPTLQQVDDILVYKVNVVRRRFEKGPLSPSECVSSLILLLYCWTATTLGQVTRTALEFALPHAVTLAEAGRTLKEKRTGYQFCTEIMNISNELQLMLVNTLRKDLEDNNPARICLALDSLLPNCPVEAIPAVIPRLIDLLEHESSHVKRKALAVIQSISQHESGILTTKVYEKIRLRLQDTDLYVAAAALDFLHKLSRARILNPREGVEMIFADFLSLQEKRIDVQRRPRFQLVKVIGKLISESLVMDPELEIVNDFMDALFRMIESATQNDQAFVLECFRAISRIPVLIAKQRFASNGFTTFSFLGQLINSQQPNTQYLFITCLLELDPALWAGNVTDIPPAFDERQVHTIMGFLESSDSIIRVKVLNRVDRDILLMHLTQLISAVPAFTSSEKHRLAERVLEVSAVYERNGGAYANRVREVCVLTSYRERSKGNQKGTDTGVRLVSENVVEEVLLHLQSTTNSFRGDFVDAIVRIPVSDAGPTLTLVIAATVCEYGALSTIPQKDLLRGLATRLEDAPPAIQEALLLTMLRVTARCESNYADVSAQVRKLHDISRRHIRRRCQQYLTYSENMTSLRKVVEYAKSDTLPDFLLVLETAELHTQESPSSRHRSRHNRAGSENSRSPSAHEKLRYEAYEPPPPAFRLTRRASSTTSADSHATSSHSSHSDLIAPYSLSGEPRTFRTAEDSQDGLSRTLTAGDLALAAHTYGFSRSDVINPRTEPLALTQQQARDTRHHTEPDPVEDLISKTDLIALDSPFLAEPSQLVVAANEQITAVDFEFIWESLKDQPSARGWCQSEIEELEQRVRGMTTYVITSLPPDVHQGDTKLVLSLQSDLGVTRETSLLAAVRLRPGEEGSTLWQMRCFDSSLKAALKKVFDDV